MKKRDRKTKRLWGEGRTRCYCEIALKVRIIYFSRGFRMPVALRPDWGFEVKRLSVVARTVPATGGRLPLLVTVDVLGNVQLFYISISSPIKFV